MRRPVAYRNTRLAVDELERVDLGKMNLQLIANVEGQDRAQCGENEAGGMISFVSRARKHVGNGASEDRSDNTSMIVQKIVKCSCITAFAITPEIRPIRTYQTK